MAIAINIISCPGKLICIQNAKWATKDQFIDQYL